MIACSSSHLYSKWVTKEKKRESNGDSIKCIWNFLWSSKSSKIYKILKGAIVPLSIKLREDAPVIISGTVSLLLFWNLLSGFLYCFSISAFFSSVGPCRTVMWQLSTGWSAIFKARDTQSYIMAERDREGVYRGSYLNHHQNSRIHR